MLLNGSGKVVLAALLILGTATGCDDGSGNGLFAYDADTPLSIRTEDSWQNGDLRITDVTYSSPRGGRVPALVVAPRGGGPFAALISQHGLPANRHGMLQVAEEFARTGAVVIAIDAPWARRPDGDITFTTRDRADQIQLMVDLRRAVDILQARTDVDDDRIAYLGISYGGAMGGLLAGIEDRIAAFVLAVGDGGLVSHFTGADDAGGGPLSQLPPERRKAWLAAMEPIEPLKWIERADAPILFLSGRQDVAVPPADAREYHEAADEPKDVRWYDSGHFLPPEAWCDAARWLEGPIDIAGDEHVACG